MGSVSEVRSRRESKQSALAEDCCHYLFSEAVDMGGRAGVHSMLTRWMMRRVCAYLGKEQPLTRNHDDNDHGQRIMCRNPYRIQCYGRKVSIQNKNQSKSEAVTCFHDERAKNRMSKTTNHMLFRSNCSATKSEGEECCEW